VDLTGDLPRHVEPDTHHEKKFQGETMVRRISLLLLTVAALLSLATTNSHAQSVLTRHVREATRSGRAQAIGRLPQNQTMQLDLVLPLRDQAGLTAFLSDVYDKTSFSYHQFLTPAEFTERFGPTQADYDAVVSYAKSNGFEVVGGTRDGMEVQVKGTVASVEKAFHVAMFTYQHPTESRTFFGPDREPTTNLPFALWHISGLDNYSIPHPLFVKQERLRQGAWNPREQGGQACDHRLGTFRFLPGQRHARGLLRWHRPDRRRPEPGVVSSMRAPTSPTSAPTSRT
jgi:subtilase family serine protease